MKRYFYFWLFITFALIAKGQTATFQKIWLEHNVSQNGEKGMRVHVDFSVSGMREGKGSAIAYFDCPKGTGVKDTNGKYRTTSGTVCASENFNPPYNNTTYTDFKIFIPNNELHLYSGTHDYYCRVFVKNLNSGRMLGNSNFVSFSGTGNSNRGDNSNHHEQTWREELGYGMFAINKGDPNGVRQRTIWRACSACRGTTTCQNCYGTGKCTICNGQGHIITAGYGSYIVCMACAQSGKCGICHGTGKCICTKYDYPGYMPGSTMVIGANGQIIYNSSNYDGSGSSSTSSGPSSHSSTGTCPKCGGRKYESTAYDHAAASASGWAQPYHNYGGSSCPYCNSRTDHYHYPCTECRGFGHK